MKRAGGRDDDRHAEPTPPELQELERVTIRFAGDSGDGMQLTGTQFTRTAAVFGNDISTLPDFPAEIRAPAGSLPGVSGFQLSFSARTTSTRPGDEPDVLVAMNPAALKTNVGDLPAGGALIVNSDAFTQAEPQQGRLRGEPADRRLAQAVHALRDPDLDAQRALARRPRHDEQADGPDEELLRARDHVLAVRARAWTRRSAGSTTSSASGRSSPRPTSARSRPATRSARRPRSSTPTTASRRPSSPRARTGTSPATRRRRSASWPRRKLADRPLFYGSYPITPARDILHQLSGYKNFGVKTFQAEDEIAAIGAAIGASYGGAMGMTASSGPGIALKSEALGLAVMVELPLVVIDVQRAGPSTGMPTKNEQADLLQVMFGRNSRLAAADRRAGDARRVLRPRDRGVAARAQVHDPGRLPVRRVPRHRRRAVARSRRSPTCPTSRVANCDRAGDASSPYERDPDTLARPWAVPGTPGPRAPDRRPREGRHHRQRQLRPGQPPPDAAPAPGEGRRIADDIPPLEVFGPDRRRPADPRLGLDVRRDPERGRAPPGRGPERRPRPPAPPQPVPGEHRGGPPELPPGAHPGGQPRPAADADPGPVPDRRRGLQPGPRQAVPDRRDRGRGRADPRRRSTR